MCVYADGTRGPVCDHTPGAYTNIGASPSLAVYHSFNYIGLETSNLCYVRLRGRHTRAGL
jgi:hypothetical protein